MNQHSTKPGESPKTEADDHIHGVLHRLFTVEEIKMMSDKYKMTPIDPNSEWQRHEFEEASEFFYSKN